MENNAQISLSCFLVWKGILDYKEGDYWSSIEENTGISDPKWKSKIGEVFICCLKNYRFPIFEIEDAHKYVSNILIHGMIPNSCLNEYFSKVLYPLVIKELISCDFKEISFLIQNWRDCEFKKLEIEDQLYLLNSI